MGGGRAKDRRVAAGDVGRRALAPSPVAPLGASRSWPAVASPQPRRPGAELGVEDERAAGRWAVGRSLNGQPCPAGVELATGIGRADARKEVSLLESRECDRPP